MKTLGWLRWVLGAVAFGLTWLVVDVVAEHGPGAPSASNRPALALLVCVRLIAAFALWGPVLVRAMLAVWTSVVPARLSSAWWLARNASRARSEASSSSVIPLAIAVALVGALYSIRSATAATGSGNGGITIASV